MAKKSSDTKEIDCREALETKQGQLETVLLDDRVNEEWGTSLDENTSEYRKYLKQKAILKKRRNALNSEVQKLKNECGESDSSEESTAGIPTSIPVPFTINVEPEFEFANRTRELQDLRDLNIRFRQITGPAGYGKTHLLRRLAQDFRQQGKIIGWLSFETEQGARKSILEALNSLMKSIGAHEVHDVDQGIEDFVSQVVALLQEAERGTSLILCFDGIDRAEERVLAWIEDDFLPNLQQRQLSINWVNAFFTSRYEVERLRPGIGASFHVYPLTPFRQSHILDVVNYKYTNSLTTRGQLQEAIAWHILEMCLGHPKCIFKILDTIGPNPRLDKNYRLIDAKNIIEKIVKPIIYEEILVNAISDELEIADLQVIFTLRNIIAAYLKPFSDKHFFNKLDLSSFMLCAEFLDTTLSETKLLSDVTAKAMGYSVDPVVRHFFNIELAHLDKPRHSKLHECAYQIFVERISANYSSGMSQLLLIIEALYHLCCGLINSNQSYQDNYTTITNRIKEWQPNFRCGELRSRDYPKKLTDLIIDDFDLPLVLRMVIGDTRINDFLNFLRTSLACEPNHSNLEGVK